jgi:serine/threonine protein kinase
MDVPQIIAGRFRIECEIGKGGMGTVYRATHLGLERPVAVKIIKQEYAFDRDVADRFMREARTMARLRHSHAAMIFDAGNLPDGRHFIIMEYVEGRTLCEALATESPFSPQRAVSIAADICSVLSEAHSLGIIHRDLKPSNIMLNERGVRVLDFGVAKVLATSADATATHATTGSGIIVGTPRYMSPEQCLGLRIEPRSDLYSLGVLVFEMLTGRPPFIDPLQSAVLVKQATEPPPLITTLRPGIPPRLAAAVDKLLAKRPEQRPANAIAARMLLEQSIASRQPRPRVFDEPPPFASTVANLTMPQRSNYFRAITPLAMLFVLTGLIYLWRGGLDFVSRGALPVEAASISSKDSAALGARSPIHAVPPITTDGARRIVDALSQGEVRDVRLLRSPGGDAIVALHDDARRGARAFILEEYKGKFRMTKRIVLDKSGFKDARWTTEQLDLDGDGYDEVLYKGKLLNSQCDSTRVVLYAPRTRTLYSVFLRKDAVGDSPVQMAVTENLKNTANATFRKALENKARDLAGVQIAGRL